MQQNTVYLNLSTAQRVSGGTALPAQPRRRQVAVQVSLMPDTVDAVL